MNVYVHRVKCIQNYNSALSAVIVANGLPGELQNYSLTCSVSGGDYLGTINILWDRVGIRMGISQAPNLTFNPLNQDDAGEYRCTISISSMYFTGTLMETLNITVASKSRMMKFLLPG